MMRRSFAFAFLVLTAGPFSGCAGQSVADEAEVRDAVTGFLRAFENGDLTAMEESFAGDAVTFPRVIMSAGTTGPIQTGNYMRVNGLDPGMRELIASWHETGVSGPPYMALDPQDLQVQMFADAALVTFRLEDGAMLSRRTFVLAKRGGSWKIVHLHASNVIGSE